MRSDIAGAASVSVDIANLAASGTDDDGAVSPSVLPPFDIDLEALVQAADVLSVAGEETQVDCGRREDVHQQLSEQSLYFEADGGELWRECDGEGHAQGLDGLSAAAFTADSAGKALQESL